MKEQAFHAMKLLPKYDYVTLLQPTSPLRQADDIDGCLEKCLATDGNACVSVTEVRENPYWMYTIEEDGTMCQLIQTHDFFYRRQDLPKVYKLNGAVYVAKYEWLLSSQSFLSKDTLAYVMPWERSVDIDTEYELKYVDFFLGNNYPA